MLLSLALVLLCALTTCQPSTAAVIRERLRHGRSAAIPLTREQLEHVQCLDDCAVKALEMIRERRELAETLSSFVQRVNSTLHIPRRFANKRSQLVRDDMLGFVARVWRHIAAGDIKAAVDQQSTVLDKLEFVIRMQELMEKATVRGKAFQGERGLVGGPVYNSRCLSGASLAGAVMPSGAPACMPVDGFVANGPISCASFEFVPNSVMKTLGDKDFARICEEVADCKYYRIVSDGYPGMCLPRVEYADDTSDKPIRQTEEETAALKMPLLGGAIRDSGCDSGFARAGLAGGKRCIQQEDLSLTPQQAAAKINAASTASAAVKAPVAKDRSKCIRTHRARLQAIIDLRSALENSESRCAKLKNSPADAAHAAEVRLCEQSVQALTKMLEAQKKEVSECTVQLHTDKCDMLTPEPRCGKKPWCASAQVDVLVRLAAGTDADCCNTYSCLSRGFSDGSEKEVIFTPLQTSNTCPDFSEVAPLAHLKQQGVSQYALKGYRLVCERTPGCLYLQSSNTCV